MNKDHIHEHDRGGCPGFYAIENGDLLQIFDALLYERGSA